MVARLTSTQPVLKLTPENHPENAPALPETEPQPTFSLASTIGLGSLCALVGMTIGSMALSTAFLSENKLEVLFLLPLVGLAVSILGGWVGAFAHMVRSDSQRK